MRIGGKQLKGPTECLLVLPRDPDPIVLRARAVKNLDEFVALCPEPKAPGVLTKDGFVPDTKDENYKILSAHHDLQKLNYLVIKSLEASQIEWTTVQLANPKTWAKWRDDLRNNGDGLTEIELNKVTQLVLDANCLNEKRLEEAREVFLLGQAQAAAAISSQNSEQANTPSGEPAPA